MQTVSAPALAFTIVRMEEKHRHAVIDLFNHYVETSFSAYPDEAVSYVFFDHLMKMCERHTALVGLTDTGDLAGFALLRPYQAATTFRHTAEVSYFISPAYTRKGLGRMFLERLTEEARKLGVDCLVASVSSKNDESLFFHRKNGFEECGYLRNVGLKFGQHFGVVWFQKRI